MFSALAVKTPADLQAETSTVVNVQEFWNCRSIEEGKHYFAVTAPEHRHLLVSKLASSALDKKENDVKLVAELFSSVAGETCPEESFEAGLAGIVVTVDDLAVDVPKAYSFFALLLRGSKLSQTTVEELSTMIVFDGNPLIPPPKKLMTEFEELSTTFPLSASQIPQLLAVLETHDLHKPVSEGKKFDNWSS